MATEKRAYTAFVGVDKELEVFGLEPSATMKEVKDAYEEALNSLTEIESEEDEETGEVKFEIPLVTEETKQMIENYDLAYKKILQAKTEQRYGDVQIISNSSHYKLAGNSIVCDVLMYIYEEFLYPTGRRLSGEITDMFAQSQFVLQRDWKKDPLRVVTLCSGYDSQCIAFDMLRERYPDFRYELMAWAEFDPESRRPLSEQPAVVAHNLLFPQWQQRNLGDMTKIDWKKFMEYEIEETKAGVHGEETASAREQSSEGHNLQDERDGTSNQRGVVSGRVQQSAEGSHRIRPLKPGDIDFLTYSTPCQSISQAGKREGIKKDSGTRSAVLWFTEHAVEVMRPKVLLQENVRALINQVNMPDFREWCQLLEKHGYVNFLAPSFPISWAKEKREKKTVPGILNAKHYGVAQNRERVYMVSIRRDILGNMQYEFPRPFELKTCIADILEENVSEKFFLKPDSVIKFLSKNEDDQQAQIFYEVTDHKLSDEEIQLVRQGGHIAG
jgi:DNA (cytosine-5)-methyltransferase 1